MSVLQFLILEVCLADAELIQAKLTAGGIDYEMVRVNTRADLI